MLVCVGCADDDASAGAYQGRLEIDPQLAWRGGELEIDAGVTFEPTARMREALERGVDLELEVVTRVSQRIGPVALIEYERHHPIIMRFLPLTEQWQLEIADQQTNFPRLWLMLDALQQTRRYPTGLKRDQTDDAAWQIQARTRFNREALPPPMHLPSLVSSQWRLAGAWHTWQIDPS